MKKTIAILLLAVMVFSLTACKPKTEEGGTDETAVIGNWLVKDCKPLTLSSTFYGTTLALKEDKTFTWTHLSGQKVDSGTYKVVGKTLYLNDKMFGYEIDGEQMTLSGNDGTLTLKKMG